MTPLYGKAISVKRVGRFRGTLSNQEAALVEQLAAPLFERFGYGEGERPMGGLTP